jgi:hypothetical protein
MNELQKQVLEYFVKPARSWQMADHFPDYDRDEVHQALYSLVGAGLIYHIRGKTNDAVYMTTRAGKVLLLVDLLQ